jgi:hypothetical protein
MVRHYRSHPVFMLLRKIGIISIINFHEQITVVLNGLQSALKVPSLFKVYYRCDQKQTLPHIRRLYPTNHFTILQRII